MTSSPVADTHFSKSASPPSGTSDASSVHNLTGLARTANSVSGVCVARCHDIFCPRTQLESVDGDARGDAELGDDRKHPGETEQCMTANTPMSRLGVISLTSAFTSERHAAMTSFERRMRTSTGEE